MQAARIATRFASFLILVLLTIQTSPIAAAGPQEQSENYQNFEVTFTKWGVGVTAPPAPPFPPADPGQNKPGAGNTGITECGTEIGDAKRERVAATHRFHHEFAGGGMPNGRPALGQPVGIYISLILEPTVDTNGCHESATSQDEGQGYVPPCPSRAMT